MPVLYLLIFLLNLSNRKNKHFLETIKLIFIYVYRQWAQSKETNLLDTYVFGVEF